MGIAAGAVRHPLQKEGKDPNIVDMDPSKSYNSQVKDKSGGDTAVDVPLKDDPEFTKFFKVSFSSVRCLTLYSFGLF